MQKPNIKSVEIKKTGRFWSVFTDKKLAATVLYKKGALALQELIQALAGIRAEPMSQPAKGKLASAKAPTKSAKHSAKPAAKSKPVDTKPKPSDAKPAGVPEPVGAGISTQPVAVG